MNAHQQIRDVGNSFFRRRPCDCLRGQGYICEVCQEKAQFDVALSRLEAITEAARAWLEEVETLAGPHRLPPKPAALRAALAAGDRADK